MGVGTSGGKVGVDVAAYGVVVKGEPGIVRDIDKYTAAGGVCLDLLRTDIGEDTEISRRRCHAEYRLWCLPDLHCRWWCW